jgi:hypothetical protein
MLSALLGKRYGVAFSVRISAMRPDGFGDGQLNFDFWRRQQCVVYQAAMHGTHEAFGLFLGERNRALDMDIEVAEARGLLELFGGD